MTNGAAKSSKSQATPASEYPGTNPYLIAVLVSVATFMEVLDTTIANVALRYISGGLAVGPDEAAWVVTSYLVANSIVLCASSWLVEIFGRKAFFMACIVLFTVSSACCGFAWSLQSLLIFRVFQGLAGGGMTPVAQSILAAAFPPDQRPKGFAIYGIAVVLAPAMGPALGGWLSDNWSWHWCFLINVPVGIASLASIALLLPTPAKEKKQRQKLWKSGNFRFDAVGFLLVATFLGALEVVLDRGQEDDWFGSHFIVSFAALSAVALILFIPWELMRKHPLIDLKMLGSRQFGTCFLIMLGMGAILIATTQFLPQILQDDFGGVSLAQTTLARREQFHQARLAEHVGTWNPVYGETLQQVQNYFATKPLFGSGAGAYRTAVAWIGQQVQLQASLWAYIDVFFSLMLIGIAISALALTLRPSKSGAAAQAAA
jgi:DHA2 family multidrug resistance protein